MNSIQLNNLATEPKNKTAKKNTKLFVFFLWGLIEPVTVH